VENVRILRSMLFVPGNNMRMIHKASTLEADAVILDLEDAVPMAEKETARIFVRDSIELVKSGGPDVFVRVNALTTGLVADDLDAVICQSLDGIMFPKSDSKADVLEIQRLIEEIEGRKGLRSSCTILPLIETAKGVLNADEIATASDRVIALSFGAVDFTRDMGVELSSDGMELLYPRARIAISARAAGIQAVDAPWVNISDKAGLLRDAQLAKRLGFKGKLVIHPSQIEPVNQVFSPTPEEVEYAKKVVKAFKEGEARGLGAVSLDGKMIDIANFRQSEELLSLAEAIAERGREKKSVQEAG
jgi:citrate lyase subunit beta/citryl-CoA lyase